MSTGHPSSIRTCSASMMAAIEEYKHEQDIVKLRSKLVAAVRPVIDRADLFELGAVRKGNHISNSKYLYYDGDLCVTLDEFPKGKFIPPHDHGVWEAIVLVRGSMQHTVYDRVDDRKTEGHAKLQPSEDVTMKPGDISMVMPPDDIHSFTALEDGTFGITIVGGEYSLLRHYYSLDDDKYVVRAPKGMVREAVVE
ncbi:hypothetical protein GG851_18410 [Bordetella petrii]|nr:hypothetical protein [Bordetella petrii]